MIKEKKLNGIPIVRKGKRSTAFGARRFQVAGVVQGTDRASLMCYTANSSYYLTSLLALPMQTEKTAEAGYLRAVQQTHGSLKPTTRRSW
jgi:hypothetical protein